MHPQNSTSLGSVQALGWFPSAAVGENYRVSLKLSAGLRLRLQGAVLKAAGVAPPQLAGSRGDRQAIYEFSAKSRRNMIERILCLDERALMSALWVRLSYYPEGGADPVDGETVKRHLDNLSKRFKRRFPGAWSYWKQEFADRKSGDLTGLLVPHFHLLVGGTGLSSLEFEQWLSEAWAGVVRCAHPDFLKNGVKVFPVYGDLRRLSGYISKYMGKAVAAGVLQEFGWFGRSWGTWGRDNLPLAPVRNLVLKVGEVVQFNRLVRSWLRRRGKSGYRYARHLAHQQIGLGCVLFGISSAEAQRLIDHAVALAARPRRVVMDLAAMTETVQSRWTDGEGRPLSAEVVSFAPRRRAARVWGAVDRRLPPSLLGENYDGKGGD